MDAQVVYGFHNLRNEKPYLANGRPYISPMKLYILATVGLMASSWCIAQTTLVQGLYKHQQNICYNLNGFRGLTNIMTLHIKTLDLSEWEKVPVPKRHLHVRVVALNLHSYGSGRTLGGGISNYIAHLLLFVDQTRFIRTGTNLRLRKIGPRPTTCTVPNIYLTVNSCRTVDLALTSEV
ncbi:hypothetical protein HID58_046057 [Brassica napus]|uniref:Uncharacterized protein n=1 Tax=Brassica napus TaxID=3708 RepID=A0ABQ8AVG9_BRANA|nr:hypothetical protein HID58_046057 [Brassica napus]